MNQPRRFIVPFIALGALAGLVLAFRSFLMANILEPIATLLWALWRMAASVDQNIYWVILIAVWLIFIIRLFPYRTEGTLAPSYGYKYSRLAPIEQWRKLIGEAALGKDEADRLRERLRLLMESVNSLDEHADRYGTRENALTGRLQLSPEARKFLFPEASPAGRPGFASLLPRWARRSAGKFIRHDTTLIEQILEQLETEMELKHD